MMRQQNHKRYGRKPTAKRQWLKFAVLAFGVADAAGIYYAHETLNKPVPNSLQGELLALQQQSQAETPRVINPVANERLAVAQGLGDPARLAVGFGQREDLLDGTLEEARERDRER